MRPEFILSHEWIGLEVEVVDSRNKCEVGIRGIVIDETQNTLKIRTDRGVKTIIKKGRTFRVKFDKYVLRVSGDLINFRPEERIKRGLLILKRAKGVRI